jgi:hypothetical protein
MKKIEIEIEEEKRNGEYDNKITGQCYICKKPIPKTLKWYMIYGNACIKCLTTINKRLKEKKYEQQ